MSRFSGKCDFCDVIEICGLDFILNCEVFVGTERIELKTLKDCVPYYPHIVMSSYTDHKRCTGVILLSERSWVDMEEERYGHGSWHDWYRAELRREIEKWNIITSQC